jgi:hypothetical protein
MKTLSISSLSVCGIHIILVSFFLNLSFPAIVFSENTEQKKVIRPTLDVQIYQESQSIFSSFDLLVKISNSSEDTIYLESINITVPDKYSEFNNKFPITPKQDELYDPNYSKNPIRPLYEKQFVFKIKTGDELPLWKKVLKLFFFSPNKYNVYVHVVYQFKSTPSYQSGQLIGVQEIFLTPPIYIIIIGCLLGALLVSITATLVNIAYGKSDYLITRLTSISVVTQTFFGKCITVAKLWFIGIVTSVIIVLLLSSAENFVLPISIQVNDWKRPMSC